MITYENLTKRIEIAKKEKEKEGSSYTKGFWAGYLQSCRDIRNNINSK